MGKNFIDGVLDIESDSSNAVILDTGMRNNVIRVQNNFSSASSSTEIFGFYSDNVTSSSNFSRNKITVKGYAGIGNQVMAGLFINGDTDFSNIRNNDFISENINSDNASLLIRESDFNISNNFSNNRFVASHSGRDGRGLFLSNDSSIYVGKDFSAWFKSTEQFDSTLAVF